MGQRRIVGLAAILTASLFVVAVVTHWGRDVSPANSAKEPRVASLTPAGTDLVIGIGAADHLVGISNYDQPRPGIKSLPKIGDYDGVDWEKLAPLKPQILITQYGGDRFPASLEQNCKDRGVRIVNIHIDNLADIYRETEVVAQAIGESEKGKQAIAALKAQLDAVSKKVAGEPLVLAVVVTSDSGDGLAGPGEFLDELLSIAGGKNAAASFNNPYPSVDREALLAMAPQVVIQLIPDGEKTPQVMAKARQFWDSMPNLPAVKNHQVHILTDSYVLFPGLRVGSLAEKFAQILHPGKFQ